MRVPAVSISLTLPLSSSSSSSSSSIRVSLFPPDPSFTGETILRSQVLGLKILRVCYIAMCYHLSHHRQPLGSPV
ncbi:hypothetical protein RJT34_31511 [Clitoria ternatea]|uniref:Uncharacterized protein n=1 Tax=Clitoria ternatea TaxID=43366 RepID=A0AAN9EUF0_CLITE